MMIDPRVAGISAARRDRVYTFLFWGAALAIIFVSIYAAGKQIPSGGTVFSILFGFGPVIEGLVHFHRLGSLNENYGWWCYAGRMPLIPVLGALSYKISPKAVVFLVIKDLICWSLWIYALRRLKSHYRISDKLVLLILAILLLAPYDLSIAGKVEAEEGFLFTFVALLFSLLLTLDGIPSAIGLGLLLAAIYLTKSSMLLLCAAAVLWLFIKYWKVRPALVVVPLLGLFLAVVGWGSYTYAESGVFAIGADTSSWNGWNFYKGNNAHAYPLYPRVLLDVLDDSESAHKLLPYVSVHNEWELSHAQLALGKEYAREHLGMTARMDMKKLWVACCDLGEAPETTVGHTRKSVMISNAVNHVVLACVFAIAFWNLSRRRATDAEQLVLVLTVAYLLPYFGGFLYMRHMVPVYGLGAIVLCIQIARLQKTGRAMDLPSSPFQTR